MTVKDGLFLLGKSRSVVYDTLSARNYSYKSKSENIEQFHLIKSFGYSDLSVAFANDHLKDISWSESILYSGIILSEIAIEGFEKDEELSTATAFVFYNQKKHLSLNLFDHSSEGYFVIVIGPLTRNIKSSHKQINTPQQNAIPNQRIKTDSSSEQIKTLPKSNKPKAIMSKQNN